MQTTTERSPYPPAAGCSCSKPLRQDGGLGRRRLGEGGFTLVEVMICTLILTTGMLAIAGLLAVTTQMHMGAREAARSSRLAEEKIDELMKLNLATNASVAVGGDLDANVVNFFEEDPDGVEGVTIRWSVVDGPVTDTRILTVHVENLRTQQYGRSVELTTIIRQW